MILHEKICVPTTLDAADYNRGWTTMMGLISNRLLDILGYQFHRFLLLKCMLNFLKNVPFRRSRKLNRALPMKEHKCYQEEGSRKYSLLTLPQRYTQQASFLKVCLKLDRD